MKVRIKKNPVITENTIEISTQEKWDRFIQSIDQTEWKWLKQKLGLLNQSEWLKILDLTNKAESGKLDTGSK
jgi:hypothetical protein